MKLLAGRTLARAIRRMLQDEGQLRCAVAFWGPAAAAQAAARSAKVVLDVSMGCTSRNALLALGVPRNRNVKVLDGLHAKLYISHDRAIVTSANASRNALGSDLIPPLLEEAGVLIERRNEPTAYAAAKRLFQRYWNAATVAGSADLRRAAKATPLSAARDHQPPQSIPPSVLDELLAEPTKFAQCLFIFGDERLTRPEAIRATEAYERSIEQDEDATPRRLICATYDHREDLLLQEASYVIMYWFGRDAGILAYHDIVRVPTGDGLIAFFGRKHWSTVRSRLKLFGIVTVTGYWQADRDRAEMIACRDGRTPGGRFVILRHDELHEALEWSLIGA